MPEANGPRLWRGGFLRAGGRRRVGDHADYDRPADSGFRALHHFCPACGSTVFWEPSRRPEMIAVAVGAFADPAFPAPRKVVFEEHRHPWAAVALDRD
jgi:hypothetical protein